MMENGFTCVECVPRKLHFHFRQARNEANELSMVMLCTQCPMLVVSVWKIEGRIFYFHFGKFSKCHNMVAQRHRQNLNLSSFISSSIKLQIEISAPLCFFFILLCFLTKRQSQITSRISCVRMKFAWLKGGCWIHKSNYFLDTHYTIRIFIPSVSSPVSSFSLFQPMRK